MQSISDEHGIGVGHAYHMRNTLLRRAGAALKTRKWKNAALNHAAKYIRKATAVTAKMCNRTRRLWIYTFVRKSALPESEKGEITEGNAIVTSALFVFSIWAETTPTCE